MIESIKNELIIYNQPLNPNQWLEPTQRIRGGFILRLIGRAAQP